MTTDDPQARAAMIPTFKPPSQNPGPHPTSTLTQDPPPRDPTSPPSRPSGVDGPVGRMYRKPDTEDPAPARRTETSSDGDVHKPTAAEATALLVGLLGVVAVSAAALIRWRTGRKLRPPTRQQTNDIAAPLGRIALRLSDLSWVGPNIIDGIKAATATGAYINDGPILLGEDYDPGIPDDLQGDLR